MVKHFVGYGSYLSCLSAEVMAALARQPSDRAGLAKSPKDALREDGHVGQGILWTDTNAMKLRHRTVSEHAFLL